MATLFGATATPLGFGATTQANLRPVEVGTYRGSAATTTGTVTVPAGGIPAGKLIVIAAFAAGSRTFTATDARGNVYASNVVQSNSTTLAVCVLSGYVKTALLAGDLITVTINSSANFGFGVYAVPRSLGVSFDKATSATGTGTAANSGTAAATVHPDEILFGIQCWNATAGTYTAMDASWRTPPTNPLLLTTTTIRLGGVEYKTVAATGAYAANASYSGASTQWAAAVASFRAVGKLELLVDSFAASVDKAVKWPGSSAATVWDASGQAKIPCTTAYNVLATNAAVPLHDLTGSFVFVKPTLPALGTGTRETFLEVVGDEAAAQNKLRMYVSGATLTAAKLVAGVTTGSATATYNATTHAWWRIRESGGTVFWDYSADGLSWTNLYNVATPFAITGCWLNIASGYYGTETAADTLIDNVNVAPAGVQFGVVAAPFSFGALTQGRRKTFAATATPITFAAVTQGLRRTLGQVARATSFGAVFAAQRKTFSSFAAPFVFAKAVQAQRKTFGLVARPIVFGAATQAQRKAFGVVARPITVVIVVNAKVPGQAILAVADARFVFGALTRAKPRPQAAVVLNYADALRLGTQPVSKVYVGATQVWPEV